MAAFAGGKNSRISFREMMFNYGEIADLLSAFNRCMLDECIMN